MSEERSARELSEEDIAAERVLERLEKARFEQLRGMPLMQAWARRFENGLPTSTPEDVLAERILMAYELFLKSTVCSYSCSSDGLIYYALPSIQLQVARMLEREITNNSKPVLWDHKMVHDIMEKGWDKEVEVQSYESASYWFALDHKRLRISQDVEIYPNAWLLITDQHKSGCYSFCQHSDTKHPRLDGVKTFLDAYQQIVDSGSRVSGNSPLGVCLNLLAFLNSEYIPKEAKLPDRGARRRGEAPAKEVTFVYLRKPQHGPEPEQPEKPLEPSERHYHVQWLVSGHIRNQPCGPNHSLRRPIWIPPHMKGPADAPFRQHVYKVVR